MSWPVEYPDRAALRSIQLLMAGSGFDTTTDSLEKISDAITALAGAGAERIIWNTTAPNFIRLGANGIFNVFISTLGSNLPTTAEITEGTYTVSRQAKGGTTWAAVASGVASSEATGRVYADITFGAGDYADGDGIRVVFSGISVTIDSNTTEIPDVTLTSHISLTDDIIDNLGIASGDTITSANGKLGNLSDSLDDIIETGYDSSGISANNDGSIMERLEYLANQVKGGEVSNTFSYLDAGGEQTIYEDSSLSTRRQILSVWLDFSNLTQDGTLKFYYKIDGTNYRVFDNQAWTTADDDGVEVKGFVVDDHWKITWEEGADEGAARDIPYKIIYEEKE